jgi:hypothetical protein
MQGISVAEMLFFAWIALLTIGVPVALIAWGYWMIKKSRPK